VLSGRGLCDELITRPEESYQLWCVIVCDLETSRMRRPWPNGGCCARRKEFVGILCQLMDLRPCCLRDGVTSGLLSLRNYSYIIHISAEG